MTTKEQAKYNRKYLIHQLQMAQGADYFTRKGLQRNGRKLNRLSTKQLEVRFMNRNKKWAKQVGLSSWNINVTKLQTVGA